MCHEEVALHGCREALSARAVLALLVAAHKMSAI